MVEERDKEIYSLIECLKVLKEWVLNLESKINMFNIYEQQNSRYGYMNYSDNTTKNVYKTQFISSLNEVNLFLTIDYK